METIKCEGCGQVDIRKQADWLMKYKYNCYCDSCLPVKHAELEKAGDEEALWWEHEMIRRGLVNCETCQAPKQMYGGGWCPKCDTPEIEMEPSVNLIQMLVHLEAIGNTGIKDRFWEAVSDHISNDSYFSWSFEENDYDEGVDLEDAKIISKFLGKHFLF